MNENALNIIHIASGDLWAGAEVQLYTLITNLDKKKGTDVHVVLLNHGTLEQELLQQNIQVTVFDEAQTNGLSILLKLTHFIGRTRPDIIHTHRNKENILGSLAGLLNGNIPSIRTAHGAPEHKAAWFHIAKNLILFMDWACARFLQKKIVAVSQDLANILAKQYPKNKIAVIENGIDISTFASNAASSSKPKSNNTTVNIAIAGRLVPVKRVDIFIRTAQSIQKTYPELELMFHIYGDGPLKAELQQLNQKLKTDERVIFEGHCENLQNELRQIDILLMTSDHEGLPMILLEAMATPVAIISHAVGGIPTLLDHGNCGILVSENTPEPYAAAIHHMIHHADEKNNMVQRAYKRLNEFYSAEQNARKYTTLYQSLIKRK